MSNKNPKKKLFLTFFFSRHGIAYFEQILRAFAKCPEMLKNIPHNDEKNSELFDQYELMKLSEAKIDKMPFDKALYIFPGTFHEINKEYPMRSERFPPFEGKRGVKESIEKDLRDKALDERKELIELYRQIYDKYNLALPNKPSVEEQSSGKKEGSQKNTPKTPSLEEVKKMFNDKSKNLHGLWHIINEFRYEEQKKWFEENSPFRNKAKCILLNKIKDIRDAKQITENIKELIEKEYKDWDIYINLYGCYSQYQISIYFLAWFHKNFKNATLFEAKTEKNGDFRFRPFQIYQADKKLLHTLKKVVLQEASIPPDSEREKAVKKLKFLIEQKNYFTILLTGERGSGKNFLLRKICDNEEKLAFRNCAEFPDDTMAISQLFGHKKGAFTGAIRAHKGLFSESGEKGILFLDEIHHLSKSVQAKLLTALSTDNDGNYTFTSLGDDKSQKVKFQLICATNKSIEYLKDEKNMLIDFFDRISQRVVEIPSLNGIMKKHRLEDFNELCKHLKFDDLDIEDDIKKWIEKIYLPGNFRDLEKIAITLHDYKNMEPKPNITEFDYLKQEMKKIGFTGEWPEKKPDDQKEENQFSQNAIPPIPFSEIDTHKSMEKKFKKEFVILVEQLYGSKKKAAEAINENLKRLNEKPNFSARTLTVWASYKTNKGK